MRLLKALLNLSPQAWARFSSCCLWQDQQVAPGKSLYTHATLKKSSPHGILLHRVHGHRGKYEHDEKRNAEYRKESNRTKWVF